MHLLLTPYSFHIQIDNSLRDSCVKIETALPSIHGRSLLRSSRRKLAVEFVSSSGPTRA